MSKKKREHVTFDRMPDQRVRVSKKAFVTAQQREGKPAKQIGQAGAIKIDDLVEDKRPKP